MDGVNNPEWPHRHRTCFSSNDMKNSSFFSRTHASVVSALAAVAIVLATVCPAAAQQVYTVGDNSQFGTLNVTNGTFTAIGTGHTTYNGTNTTLAGVAYAANSNLYGLDYTGRFFQINRTSGVLTLIGTATGLAGSTQDVTIGNTSDGTIYGIYAGSTTTGPNLYTINPATGATTLVGNTGTTYFDGGLGGDGNNNLFATGGNGGSQSFRVNRITGAATVLAATTAAGTSYALAYTNSNLYAFSTTGGIYTLNTATGAATNTNVTFNTATTGSIGGAAPLIFVATVPEPGTVALLSLGGLGMVACAARRRRRR